MKPLKPIQALLYIGLPILPLLVFWFIPLFISMAISLTDWDYISPEMHFVGLGNYGYLLQSEAFYATLGRTLLFALGTVIPTLIIGFALALLLERQVRGRAFFQAALFAPWITPMVAMSIVWSWMYRPEGLLNYCLSFFGVDPQPWLSSSKTALWAVMLVTIWKNAGWAMVFYANALSKISKSLFEVGYLEGARNSQRIRYIILPMVRSTTLFLSIVSLIDALQAYDQISVLTHGGPAASTRTLLYYYYELAFVNFNMGRATALAMIIVVLTALLALAMFFLKKRSERRTKHAA